MTDAPTLHLCTALDLRHDSAIGLGDLGPTLEAHV
jgi:hypothetical protein